jgi:hypothetical protein
MEPFKAQRFLEADSPGFSRRDKSKIPYKEDAILKIASSLTRSNSRESVSVTPCPRYDAKAAVQITDRS